MMGLGQQSKPAFTDMCTPSELLGHKGRMTKRGFAVEKHGGRRSIRRFSDGETPAGGGDGLLVVG